MTTLRHRLQWQTSASLNSNPASFLAQQDAESAVPDRFVGTEPDPVPDGGVLTVKFDDPERAGQVVAVTACDGDDPTEVATVDVKLRGNGKGTGLLIVPVGWGSVVLSCAWSQKHTIAVAVPP